ncbi:MAG: DUF423 domain-containing protein [Gammaproteobacteria bacterium]
MPQVRSGIDRLFIALGALNGAFAVGMGAFGAHGLRGRIEERLFDAYQTGAEYHLLHAVALVVVGLMARTTPPDAPGGMAVRLAGWSMLSGMVLFSGSLYVMAVTGLRFLGAITPLGGTAFILAWVALAVAAWKVR